MWPFKKTDLDLLLLKVIDMSIDGNWDLLNGPPQFISVRHQTGLTVMVPTAPLLRDGKITHQGVDIQFDIKSRYGKQTCKAIYGLVDLLNKEPPRIDYNRRARTILSNWA